MMVVEYDNGDVNVHRAKLDMKKHNSNKEQMQIETLEPKTAPT